MTEYESQEFLFLEEIKKIILKKNPNISSESLAIQAQEEYDAQSFSGEDGAEFLDSIE